MLRFGMVRQYPEKLHMMPVGLPPAIYRQLSELAAETGYSIATVIRECLTSENINKAAEALKVQRQKEAQR
jgi:hypothetical protein